MFPITRLFCFLTTRLFFLLMAFLCRKDVTNNPVCWALFHPAPCATFPFRLLRQVDSMQNFTWQQQLRYYWDMDLDDCLIRHSDARVRYGYEYMGATRYTRVLL